ncbi:toll/interleukin-1 receptor domain-containing protein [Pectobacterium brasiliense]|uniref:toll/interleukin-1 receptor domain-containing protein n=1 Tax=Pectobacterium brasiliense TaxID=180957 RepID=UPI00227AE5A7|nr:toll/interleukin-1 receptor domain-containing protein [Pectobacterium brasiliense]WGL26770.1 toll/interleukin-1 receptor domain-containing protein [Pectobacterium brasiliense]
MVKVFISHQVGDSSIANKIERYLRGAYGIESYLDTIDPTIQNGEDLAEYIRSQLTNCTQLLAVVSEKTQESWWVPWEIGVASEKNYPLATYAEGSSLLPEYLRKWPYLRNEKDLDYYAQVSKKSKSSTASLKRRMGSESNSNTNINSTREFYNDLRRKLGQ